MIALETLCIGGPLNGRRVRHQHAAFEAPIPAAWSNPGEATTTEVSIRSCRYQRQDFHDFGNLYSVYVADGIANPLLLLIEHYRPKP